MAKWVTEATEEEEVIEVMEKEENIEVEEETIEVEEDRIEVEKEAIEVEEAIIEVEEENIEAEEEIEKGLMIGLQKSKLLHFRIFFRTMMKINKSS